MSFLPHFYSIFLHFYSLFTLHFPFTLHFCPSFLLTALRALHDTGNIALAQSLLAEADHLNLPPDHEDRLALSKRIDAALLWNDLAEKVINSAPGRFDLDHLRSILETGRGLPVRRDLLVGVGRGLSVAEKWIQSAERCEMEGIKGY